MARPQRFTIDAKKSSVPRGYNMAGMEFSAGTIPGVESTNYTQNSAAAYANAKRMGADFVRVPFTWNRIQPTLGAALDSTVQGYLTNQVTWANANGLKILWDLHSYGRFYVTGVEKAIGAAGGPTQAQFVDFWNRFTTWINADATRSSTTWGFGLMNEPHDMTVPADSTHLTTATIYAAYNAAITEIRSVVGDTTHYITGCTDPWAGAQSFFSTHGANPVPWITDSANKFYYEVHIYADAGNSGSYSNTSWSGSGNAITYMGDKVAAICDWAITRGVLVNGKPGVLVGEWGVPNTDDAWKAAANDLYNVCDLYQIPITAWAMGEWWGTYVLSLHPGPPDKSNVSIISKHLGTIN